MLVPLYVSKPIKEKEIFNRSCECSIGPFTSLFIVYKDGKEIAFVSIDINHKMNYLALCDLLVPKHLRRNTYGEFALNEVEELAKKLFFTKSSAKPQSF